VQYRDLADEPAMASSPPGDKRHFQAYSRFDGDTVSIKCLTCRRAYEHCVGARCSQAFVCSQGVRFLFLHLHVPRGHDAILPRASVKTSHLVRRN
jgi:hypothetical protein